MSQEVFEHTFEVDSPARLKASNIRGTIDIGPGEDNVITVKAVKHNGTMDNNIEIIIEQEDDGRVRVETKQEKDISSWFGFFKPPRVDYTIRVPQNTHVKVNSVSSEACISGLTGEFQLDGVSGNLHLSNLTGPLNLGSVSGKLTARQVSGPLSLNSVSGKAQVLDSNLPSITGKTVSGDLTIQTPLTEGPYSFKSVSGNVSLVVPEDTACTINSKSLSGSAKISLPHTETRKHQHTYGPKHTSTVKVQDGGVDVSIKSVSGNIVLRTSLDAGQPALAPQAAPARSEPGEPDPAAPETVPGKATIDILQQIEAGEISVAEALEKMTG